MPKVNEQYEAARRQLIVDAAARCFTRSGYEGTSVDDVCREAGMSKGGLYTYFKSKEQLFAAVCAAHWAAGFSQMATGLEAQPNAQARLEVMGQAAFTRLGEDPRSTVELARMSLAVWNEVARNPETQAITRAGYEAWCAALEDAIGRGKQDGEIGADLDAHMLALVLIAVFDGLQVLTAVKGEPPDLEQFRQTFMRVIQGGIFRAQAN